MCSVWCFCVCDECNMFVVVCSIEVWDGVQVVYVWVVKCLVCMVCISCVYVWYVCSELGLSQCM